VRQIGAYEAKTHFSRLLDDVERGTEFIVTRGGRPVATLRPIEPRSVEERAARIQRFRQRLRAAHGSGSVLREGETWRELIHEDE
jgi:prevent-host-death family protein